MRLNLHLKFAKRLVGRCRTLEEGPIITKKEATEELVCDLEISVLGMSSSVTSKHFTIGLREGHGYVRRRTSSLGRTSCRRGQSKEMLAPA